MNETELALALIPYLNEFDAAFVEEMVNEELPFQEIASYINSKLSPKEKGHILDRLSEAFPQIENYIDEKPRYLDKDKYPPSVRRELECYEYMDDIPEDAQRWIKQFYHEYYNKGYFAIPEEERILNTEEMTAEASRINNSLTRDAFSFTKNRGQLYYLEDGQAHEADSPPDWRDTFNASGYIPAVAHIMADAIDDLNNPKLNPRATLARFYVKMDYLRKMNNRDARTRRELKRKKDVKNKKA